MLIILHNRAHKSIGEFGSEFEGLKGGSRMMSLLTLFGGLKNVFKVDGRKSLPSVQLISSSRSKRILRTTLFSAYITR